MADFITDLTFKKPQFLPTKKNKNKKNVFTPPLYYDYVITTLCSHHKAMGEKAR